MSEYGVVRVSSAGKVDVVVTSSYKLTLEQIRELVGCEVIEIVKTNSLVANLLVCDESGKVCDPPKPFNKLASCFYGSETSFFDWIAGDVIFGTVNSPNLYDEPDFFALPLGVARLFAYSLEKRSLVLGL